MRKLRKSGYVCLICERWYAEIEDAEVCERRHDEPENPRQKGDDDGQEYADPRDFRNGLE